jgi:hypothetical protein
MHHEHGATLVELVMIAALVLSALTLVAALAPFTALGVA